MNDRMTIDEKIEVLQAYKRGETIQICYPGNVWKDIDSPEFNFKEFKYRVKPKPLEVWANVYNDSSISVFYKQKELAETQRRIGGRTVHLREVVASEEKE